MAVISPRYTSIVLLGYFLFLLTKILVFRKNSLNTNYLAFDFDKHRGNSSLSLLSTPTFSRKEVFQPHLPVRLPCYDLAPVTSFTLGRSLRLRTLGTPSSHGLTGGVYKARERIHRAVADARLLANPAS